MDARPHRPASSMLKIYDENNLPNLVGKQQRTLQRNKSSPALSSTAQLGAARAVAKRNAFADIAHSINTNHSRLSKDDSLINAGLSAHSKENHPPPQAKRASTFLKPAQRPLSVSGVRAAASNLHLGPSRQPLGTLLHHIVGPAPASKSTTTVSATTTSNSLYTSALPARKQTLKNSSTIFRDPAPNAVQSSSLVVIKPIPIKATAVPEVSALPIKVASQNLIVPVEEASQALSKLPSEAIAQSQLRHSKSTYLDAREYMADEEEEDREEEYSDAAIDPALQVISGQVKLDRDEDIREIETVDNRVPAKTQDVDPRVRTVQLQQQELSSARAQVCDLPLASPTAHSHTHDDQTERSMVSKGETTTGTATMPLYPRVTLGSEREFAHAKQIVESSITEEELQEAAWDTTMVAEYGDEIFEYLQEMEARLLPNANYMDNQAEIQWSMRAVLMDWIVQVHHRFNLLPETLFLCVNYIDRFLSCKVVSLGKLQLVGITAIFIAAKYEEIDCPSIQEIIYMVDNGYTMDELLKAERFMLSMLQFELGWPGPMSFLRRISKADDFDVETRTLAKYFLEITIMDERFIGSPPSFIAAAAHCLARLMLRKGGWSIAHVYYSQYTYAQLHGLISTILSCCDEPRKHHSAIYEKYMDRRFKRAALFVEAELHHGFSLPAVPQLTFVTQQAPAAPAHHTPSHSQAYIRPVTLAPAYRPVTPSSAAIRCDA